MRIRRHAASKDRVKVGGVGDVIADVVVAEAVLVAGAFLDVLEGDDAAGVGAKDLRQGGRIYDRVDRVGIGRTHALLPIEATLQVARAARAIHDRNDRSVYLDDRSVCDRRCTRQRDAKHPLGRALGHKTTHAPDRTISHTLSTRREVRPPHPRKQSKLLLPRKTRCVEFNASSWAGRVPIPALHGFGVML